MVTPSQLTVLITAIGYPCRTYTMYISHRNPQLFNTLSATNKNFLNSNYTQIKKVYFEVKNGFKRCFCIFLIHKNYYKLIFFVMKSIYMHLRLKIPPSPEQHII